MLCVLFYAYELSRRLQSEGYSTPEHIAAIEKYGLTLLHRFSFEPVRLACRYEIWTGYDQIEMASNEASA